MRYAYTILFALAPFTLFCGEEVLLTRMAEARFQAREYEKARSLFEKLEAEKLQSWQYLRLAYNIGTTWLEEENWQEAYVDYTSLPFKPEQYPLLGRAAKTNLAVLEYNRAQEIAEKESPVLDDYSKAYYHLRESLRYLEEAEYADCFLQKVMGRNTCTVTEDLADFRVQIRREMALIGQKYGEAKIAETTPRDGIPFLLSGVKIALGHIDFVENNRLEGDLKSKYLNLFSNDLESWLSLWETQLDKNEKLQEAYATFTAGLGYFQKGELDESRLEFIATTAELSELMQLLWEMDPLLEVLQKLIASYQKALDQYPIQLPSIYQLQSEQKKAEDILETDGLAGKELQASNRLLEQSLNYLREGKSTHARIYLLEARQWLRRLVYGKSRKEDLQPDAILEQAIQEQSHSLQINRLSHQIGKDRTEIEQLLSQAQEMVLKTVQPFLPAVIQKEIREFPIRCQCRPWNVVIPLFDKGDVAAKDAAQLLSRDRAFSTAMAKQEEAVKYWKEALDKMRKPPEEEDKKQKPTPPPEEESQAEKQEDTSLNEVLQLIQKMDQDDRKNPAGEQKPQPGVKPW